MSTSNPSRSEFVIRTSAWLMVVSFFFEFPITPDEGQSMLNYGYHAAFALLSLATGMGLLKRRYWSYQLLWVATILVTIEEALQLLHPEVNPLGTLGAGLIPAFNPDFLRFVTYSTVFCVLLGWWGVLLYLAKRQDYFVRES